MEMGLLVDPNATFAVEIRFRDVYDSDGDLTGIRVLPDDAEGDGVQTLVCDAVGRDFGTMSRVKEECSIINHVSGEPMMRISRLCPLIILNFFRAWNLVDDSGAEVKITPDTVNKLHYNAVKALARKWLLKTYGEFNLVSDQDLNESR